MPILSVILKVIIAIPKIKSMFDDLVDMYRDYQISKLETSISNRKVRRKALLNAIRQAKTNDDRKELSILLHLHNINKLPDSRRRVSST